MKNIKLLLVILVLSTSTFALEATDLTGMWYLPKDDAGLIAVANLFQKDNKFYGIGFKYSDGTVNPNKDINNPDPTLRDRLIRNSMIVNGIEIKNNKLANGEIYNPEAGKYYYLNGTLSNDKKTITWKATIDKAGLFGKTLIWTKVEDPTPFTNSLHSPSELNSLIPIRQKQ
ncbi:MAG: DUF2147 domain-containing protein [Spirochaetota bacterium]|nr:DUF2147 domain-containing protein [Spirochaetota bacterium]